MGGDFLSLENLHCSNRGRKKKNDSTSWLFLGGKGGYEGLVRAISKLKRE